MYCSCCGNALPEGTRTCPACGAPAATPPKDLSLDDLIAETKRAVRDLSHAAEHASKKVISGAGAAARDPKGTTKRAARRAKKELQSAVDDLEGLLKRL